MPPGVPGGHGTLLSCFKLPHALRTGGHGRELVAIALFLRGRPRASENPCRWRGGPLGCPGVGSGAPEQRQGAGRASPGETRRVFSSPRFAPGPLRQQLETAANWLAGSHSPFGGPAQLSGASVRVATQVKDDFDEAATPGRNTHGICPCLLSHSKTVTESERERF